MKCISEEKSFIKNLVNFFHLEISHDSFTFRSLFNNAGARHERHECDTNDTSETQVKNFDFDNNTSENVFSCPYISYMVNERLQGEE